MKKGNEKKNWKTNFEKHLIFLDFSIVALRKKVDRILKELHFSRKRRVKGSSKSKVAGKQYEKNQ
uniref:Uncharacterized protein n=1 Tax=Dictyoglomus turgidum TaxID=513050 RepID=A0A7C3SNE1_9BACT